MMREIESIETTYNMAKNTAMQMIETTEIDMEDETEKAMETIMPIPTETVESPIEGPKSPVNE